MAQVGEDGGSCVLSYIEFLNSLILDLSFYQELENLRILSSVLMLYNELRRSDGFLFILFPRSYLYYSGFPDFFSNGARNL